MRVTRIYTGDDGESHFEEREIPLCLQDDIGALSELIPATGLRVREVGASHDFGWHTAPRRQYVVMLSGGRIEIEIGDGSRRTFGPGDVLLAEDTTGRGHKSRALDPEPRTALYITLD